MTRLMIVPAALALALAAAACKKAEPPAAAVPSTPPATAGREVVFHGMCDASAAIEVGPGTFVVADDEDNVLRIYDADRGGQPVAGVDVSAALGLTPKGKKHPTMPELDLEAATRIDDRAYWLTSHGRNSKAKLRPERQRFFATSVPADGAELALVGHPYERLVDDLIADPRYAAFGLAAAAERAPKDPGGLNLEGMTATTAGTLLVGFRNPVPEGRALLMEVLTPGAIVDEGAPVQVGPPIRLDLGGDGVRALTWWHGAYLIVAGHYDSGGTSRLYRWDGEGTPVPIELPLDGLNPEGTFTPEARDELMLLSDDGTVLHGDVPCKDLTDPSQRRFRGVWVKL